MLPPEPVLAVAVVTPLLATLLPVLPGPLAQGSPPPAPPWPPLPPPPSQPEAVLALLWPPPPSLF